MGGRLLLLLDGARLRASHWGYGPDIAWAGFPGGEALVVCPAVWPVFFFEKKKFLNFFLNFFFDFFFLKIQTKIKNKTRKRPRRRRFCPEFAVLQC